MLANASILFFARFRMLANASILFLLNFGCWRTWASVFRPISDADKREHPFVALISDADECRHPFFAEFRMLTNASIRFSPDFGC